MIALFKDNKKTILVLLILFCFETSIYPQETGKAKYVYKLFNVEEKPREYYCCSYSTMNSSTKEGYKVHIMISNSDNIPVNNQKVSLISQTNDTLQFITNQEGIFIVSLSELQLHPRVVINPFSIINDDWMIRYEATDMRIMELTFTNYVTNIDYYASTIFIFLKRMIPEGGVYEIVSTIPLENSDIEMIRKDIILGIHSCKLWDVISIYPYYEI